MTDIFIDMDSTMNDFTAGYVSYYNSLYGTKHVLNNKDLLIYEISKCIPGLSDESAMRARDEIFSTPGFWYDLPIYPDVKEAVDWLYNNFNTYILTAPWIPYKDCPKEKYMWIEKHLPFFPLENVIFCHDKHLIHENSLLIDDNPKHLTTFNGKTLKINYPFNKNVLTHYEADNWKGILSVIQENIIE